jgi:hypothetical protein
MLIGRYGCALYYELVPDNNSKLNWSLRAKQRADEVSFEAEGISWPEHFANQYFDKC